MSEKPQITDETGNKAKKRAFMALGVFIAFALLVWVLGIDDLYIWLKALHVIAIIAWMAGLVYLPRLFVYHSDSEIGSEQSETFKVMERRLMKIIMTPAMILSWLLGLWLAWYGGHFSEIWFLIKFLGVILLTANHLFLAKSVKRFAADENKTPAQKWRLLNEIPTVLMIIIVIMVIVKPF